MGPKSVIYTPKRNDEHPRPFRMGIPLGTLPCLRDVFLAYDIVNSCIFYSLVRCIRVYTGESLEELDIVLPWSDQWSTNIPFSTSCDFVLLKEGSSAANVGHLCYLQKTYRQ